jgi:hypothetical protein
MPICSPNKYPYPNHCVFLLTFFQSYDKGEFSKFETTVVISTKIELAIQYIKNLFPECTVISCKSLEYLKKIQYDLNIAKKNSHSILRIKPQGIINPIVNKFDIWLINEEVNNGLITSQVVMAKTMSDIEIWATEKNIKIQSLFSLTLINKTIEELDLIQSGKKVINQYAYDYSNGEDIDTANQRINNWNKDDHEWADEGFQTLFEENK